MPDSDRRKRFEAVIATSFGVLALFGAIVLLYALGVLNGSEAQRRQQTPASYSQAAKADAQRACAGSKGGASFECIYERVEASQEQARGEQDLSAQQRAATSALASAALALLTLAVTGIGVWFVKRTLDATLEAVEDTSEATEEMRKANKITRKIGEAQVRCYLDVVSAYISIERNIFRCDVEIQNSGQSPARKLRVGYQLGFVYEPKDIVDREMQWTDWHESVPGTSTVKITPWYDRRFITEANMTDWLERMAPIIAVSIKLEAKDVFGKPVSEFKGFTLAVSEFEPDQTYKMNPATHGASALKAELLRRKKQ